MAEAKKSKALFVRLEPAELVALDDLAAKYAVVTRSDVARVAMRLGLAVIEKNPMLLLEQPRPSKPSRKKRSRP